MMESGMPTIKQIARQLNISASTVSRALHDHPSIGLRTKTRVQQLARELGYEPNQTAIFFQQGRTFTIGVILPELTEAFFGAAISGIEDIAQKNKYTVLLGQSHDNAEKEIQLVETMKNHRVDGLLISIAKNTTDYTHFEYLKRYDIPVVFFDRIPRMPNIHSIECNLEAGMIQAINLLIKKGHRQIGLINGPDNMKASRDRANGYMKALQKNRLKIDNSLILSSELNRESTRAAIDKLFSLKRRPTAIIAFNDYVALDAMLYAKQKKLRISKDIDLVSFSNLPVWDYFETPPFASIEQFPYEQGAKAMETLLELLSSSKTGEENKPFFNIIFESQLIMH
jgi:LacI family repressor for deo operon, udp, cdd, tsx, nupC, and nupG